MSKYVRVTKAENGYIVQAIADNILPSKNKMWVSMGDNEEERSRLLTRALKVLYEEEPVEEDNGNDR